jgi:hypothetical protein
MRPFWRWLALFAYRRWARGEPRKPTGVPGNRDPDDPCPAYAPRPRKWNDFPDCLGDGHHLCRGCCHLGRDAAARARGG